MRKEAGARGTDQHWEAFGMQCQTISHFLYGLVLLGLDMAVIWGHSVLLHHSPEVGDSVVRHSATRTFTYGRGVLKNRSGNVEGMDKNFATM